MKIDILTLFPNMFNALNESILKRAQEKKLLSINLVNIRDFSTDLHKKCDDYPYGGGNGMIMTVQPIYDAVKSVKTKEAKVIYLSPKGKIFNYETSLRLAKEKHLVFLCGHYEGIDQRAIDLCVDEEISIGDYILTGGELACMVIVDSVSRHIKGVLGNEFSADEESFSNGLLEYPQYTRPSVFKGVAVPEILLSGNHGEIEKYRCGEALKLTQEKRPDLKDK